MLQQTQANTLPLNPLPAGDSTLCSLYCSSLCELCVEKLKLSRPEKLAKNCHFMPFSTLEKTIPPDTIGIRET